MNAKEEWLRTLVVQHEGALLRYARRFVPEAEAREVVQETYLRLWSEDVEKVQGHEAEWLFCVCRNQCLDRRKAEAKVKQSAVDPLKIASLEPTAEERLEERERETRVESLLGDLPPNQQEVIRLKFQEGFSYKEISRITGHSVSNVGVLIHEAMKRLRHEGGLQ
ncbi:MAG: sigma-70 family RNA polymerase sigma factor [Bdellovibrionaceae bacterium]|nr:sigma-70 family RNA polymerase sigma factor [Pseudobdellovibrionaceae bacterium]